MSVGSMAVTCDQDVSGTLQKGCGAVQFEHLRADATGVIIATYRLSD